MVNLALLNHGFTKYIANKSLTPNDITGIQTLT